MDADPSLDPVTPPLTFHLSFSPTIDKFIIFLQDYNQRVSSGQQLLANMTSDIQIVISWLISMFILYVHPQGME